jgi:tetratricopeptide (TPR) repeat protein/predicted Ser/Thr protein kinase
VLRLLGEGGMGVVYEAEQLEPVRRRVAIKVLKAGLDTQDFIGRFEAERQALALMDHAGIARVYDAGETTDGLPYCAMEYVAGVPLTQFCDEQRLSTRARLELMIEVCGAVHHAHQRGIIHRDLKPSNILTALKDDRGAPKVIDFGIAKAIVGRLADRTFVTELGRPIGTPAYMSPEQWEAGPLDLDTRTDIYSLGVILYEVLSGRLPRDPNQLARAGAGAPELLRDTTPPAPSTRVSSLGQQAAGLAKARRTDPSNLVRELRGDLDWIVLKALEPDRTRRYETVHGLALDLGRHLRSEPVQARSPSAMYRFGRFVRRHRVGSAAAVVGLVLGIGFTTIALVQARRISLERDRATRAAETANALNGFLQEMLAAPDPIERLGKEATMLQVVDSAAARLRTEPIASPAVDAAVKSVIGWTYFKLGVYERAGPLLLDALRTRRALPGVEPNDLAESLLRAGTWYALMAHPDSAQPLLEQALELARRSDASSHPVAEALIRSGEFFLAREDTAKARASMDEALGVYQRLGDSSGIATVRNHLGLLEYQIGNLPEARRQFGLSLAGRRHRLGDHPLVAEVLSNTGAVLEDQGHFDSAEVLYREGLAIGDKTLGPDHDQVTAIAQNLALLIGRHGKVGEAEVLFRRALASDERKLGADHPSVGIDLINLANVSCRWGDAARGEPAARRAVKIFTSKSTPSGWEVAQARVILGICLTRLRRFAEADTELRGGILGLEGALGSHWRIDSARVRLAELERLRRR